MSKPGRPKGTIKPDTKVSKTFRLSRDIIKWLETKSNMTEVIEKAIRKMMKNESI